MPSWMGSTAAGSEDAGCGRRTHRSTVRTLSWKGVMMARLRGVDHVIWAEKNHGTPSCHAATRRFNTERPSVRQGSLRGQRWKYAWHARIMVWACMKVSNHGEIMSAISLEAQKLVSTHPGIMERACSALASCSSLYVILAGYAMPSPACSGVTYRLMRSVAPAGILHNTFGF